jgi:hypothetical protein
VPGIDKGQRTVKGLTSGFENVLMVDLVLTMQPDETASTEQLRRPGDEEVRRGGQQAGRLVR